MKTEGNREQLLDAILLPEAEWEDAALNIVRRGARRRRHIRFARRGTAFALLLGTALTLLLRTEHRPPNSSAPSRDTLIVRSVPLPPEMVVQSSPTSVLIVRTRPSRTDVQSIEDDELLRLAPRGAILVRYENRTAELIQADAAVH